jgi:undecaprenyl-diphosphatase
MHAILSYLSDFDYAVLHAVQALGPKWVPVANFISYGVGSYAVMFAAFFIVLALLKKWRVAGELVAIVVVSFIALTVLKHFFAIERPYIIDPSIISFGEETSFALPSGHALMSIVILGWIALRHPKSHTLLWGSVALVILIGLSRIYLGMHYPSQVLAGWLFGILFLYIFRVIDKRLWAPFQKKLR